MEEEKKNVKKEGEERKNEKKGGSEREEIYRQMGVLWVEYKTSGVQECYRSHKRGWKVCEEGEYIHWTLFTFFLLCIINISNKAIIFLNNIL